MKNSKSSKPARLAPSSRNKYPRIAITLGDPSGIGPEVILKSLRVLPKNAHYIIIGHASVLAESVRRKRILTPTIKHIENISHQDKSLPRISIFEPPLFYKGRLGNPSAHTGKVSIAYIDQAIKLAKQNIVQAIVTAPVTKWAINKFSPGFLGQTEYLAASFRIRNVAMFFVSDSMRVAIISRHIPIGLVPKHVDKAGIRSTVLLVNRSLREQFKISSPKIAVCAMNPHAGEGGLIGSEDQDIILPAIRQLRRMGILIDGPFAADGFFRGEIKYDAIISTYHDQGLIPFKLTSRGLGAQMTLGLPTIRTSPDHGSGVDIAGKGIANPNGMIYAVKLAYNLLNNKCRRPIKDR